MISYVFGIVRVCGTDIVGIKPVLLHETAQGGDFFINCHIDSLFLLYLL